MKILLALIIFSALVLFHELGHFLLAKKNGIVVEEFSLGMGPRILSWERGGTRYSWKALPFGGSCAMLGEDTGEEVAGSFNAAPVWGRFLVVAAGPIFNFILAFLLSLIIIALAGYDPAKVSYVDEESHAYAAGLREGDLITRFNGQKVALSRDMYLYVYLDGIDENVPIDLVIKRDGEKQQISFYPDVETRYLLGFNRSGDDSMTVYSLIPGFPLEAAGLLPGDTIVGINGVEIADGKAYNEYLVEHPLGDEEVEITYERDGLTYETSLTPMADNTVKGGFAYGVGYEKVKPLEIIKYAIVEVDYMIRSTILSLKELVTGGIGMEELSGPVGVVDAIGETYEASREEGILSIIVNLLSMAVLLSANLGVMNLLPLPALDGGRLVFILLEAIRGKPVNREVEGGIHFAGFVLLMGLMVFVMYHDIIKIL